MQYVTGADPGANGGLVKIDETGRVVYKYIMPLYSRLIDRQELNKAIIKNFADSHVFIEDVRTIFGSAATANFNYGKNVSTLETLIEIHCKHTYVNPKVWQRETWQGVQVVRGPSTKNEKTGKTKLGKVDTKATSLIAFKRLFPNEDFRPSERCKNFHDGLVDAGLIAEYGRRMLFLRKLDG